MATVQELLQERVARLRELTEQIDEEVSGDADLERLSELADQLGAQGDEFAATVTEAQGILAGEGGEAQEGEEESEEHESEEPQASGGEESGEESRETEEEAGEDT